MPNHQKLGLRLVILCVLCFAVISLARPEGVLAQSNPCLQECIQADLACQRFCTTLPLHLRDGCSVGCENDFVDCESSCP